MQPRLLRTSSPATAFAALIEKAAAAGFRIGWLDLEGPLEAPAHLERAARLGALRAVGVAAGQVVVVKRLAGEPVLRDLVREHFTGCRLLLVRGIVEAPEVTPEADGWRVRWPDGAEKELPTEELVSKLRKPGFP